MDLQRLLHGNHSPSMMVSRDELTSHPGVRSVSGERGLRHNVPNALSSEEERSQLESAKTIIDCLNIHLPIHHAQSALFICTLSVI